MIYNKIFLEIININQKGEFSPSQRICLQPFGVYNGNIKWIDEKLVLLF